MGLIVGAVNLPDLAPDYTKSQAEKTLRDLLEGRTIKSVSCTTDCSKIIFTLDTNEDILFASMPMSVSKRKPGDWETMIP